MLSYRGGIGQADGMGKEARGGEQKGVWEGEV